MRIAGEKDELDRDKEGGRHGTVMAWRCSRNTAHNKVKGKKGEKIIISV